MPKDTVATLKLHIQAVERISTKKQILAFSNARLENHRTLESYNIQSGSLVYLALPLRGGYVSSSDGLMLTKPALTNAPRWHIAHEGLNIEGRCRNRFCAAFLQMVMYPYQFESFNLALEDCVLCPICRFQFKPLTCGFYNCAWKFEGIRTGDGISVCSPWKDAGAGKYHRFCTDSSQACVQWDRLLIVVKPRKVSNAAKLAIFSYSAEVSKDDICTICWTLFWINTIVSAPCGHKLHRCCYNKWSN